MSVLDSLISILAPFDCLNCGHEGDLLCSACLRGLDHVPERCYRCHHPSKDSLTCRNCYVEGGLYRVRPAAAYGSVAKDLIWRLKSNGAQSAATIMARQMKDTLVPERRYMIVPIPTASNRVRQRGYNQAELIARQLSKQTGLPRAKSLVRLGQAHQVGAGRDQRIHQLKDAYRIVRPGLVRGADVLLVDDVLTTGATLEAAAKVIKEAGAARIEAVTFAQPLMYIEKAR